MKPPPSGSRRPAAPGARRPDATPLPQPPGPPAPAAPPPDGAEPPPDHAPAAGIRDLLGHPWLDRARAAAHRMGLWAVGHFLGESASALWRTRAWSAFTIGIIALSLATVGAFLLVAENLGSLVARLSDLEVSVYLDGAATPAEVEAVGAAVAAEPGVSAVRHVTREQALALFRESSPELAALQESLGENPFPASLEVSLDPGHRDAAALRALAGRVEALPGVSVVSRDLELAARLVAASRVVEGVAAFLGGVLVLSALFTVSSVVKITIYARRDEVDILRLVGATRAYVRGTFVTEGVLQGLIGAALGLVLLGAAYRSARGWVGSADLPLLATLTTSFLSAGALAGLAALGALLGAVGSLFPLLRSRW